ncbi:hypothetical protein OS493_012401 [Desmophyllum pertusum]|uniref:Uncharacterized protein n=1 Tax=Desmophyllum pertusum TaxID=174260 RepID=A0A9X0D3L9_9CNID|nr:hypothetical protein OS493_012401 [Desmophyllum pertusum]
MLKRTHVYYNQIQHLLLVTEREFCDFTLYAEKGPVTIERIPRDEPLISRILTFLTELWTRVIAPEIFEMRIPRGLTPFILPQETSYAFEPDPSPHNVQEDMAAADPVSATSCEPLDNDDLDNKLTELPTFDSCAPVISSHTQEEMDAAEENYNEDVLSPSNLATLSPLNTPYEDSGCSKDLNTSDKDGDENYDIPSYQPPKKDASPSGENSADSRTKLPKKRKATETLPTTKAKIQKTEISIKKLNEHLDKKTYSAQANIPADEDFKSDIKSVKEKAEQSFLKALTRFHYRRLERQKIKLNQDKAKARQTCKTDPVRKVSNESRLTPEYSTQKLK